MRPYAGSMTRLLLIATAALTLLGAGAVIALAQGGSGHTSGASTDGVPRPTHVFVIVGENTSAGEITAAHAPYMVGNLKPRSAWLPNYRSFVKSSSLGQYIAMVSGQYSKCEGNNDLPDKCHQNVGNLFSQLDATHRTWVDWEQSQTQACDPVDSGAAWSKNIYSAHHNPALYFTQIQGGKVDEAITPKAACLHGDLAMGTTGPNDTSALDAALASGHVSNFNLIVPNDCADGHDECGTKDHVRQFDDFVADMVPKIEHSPGFAPGDLIAITWDEGNDPPKNPANPLLIMTGDNVKPGVVSTRYDHYSLARTLEDAFGVPHLAHARTAKTINVWR